MKTILVDLRCKRKNMQLLYGSFNRVTEFQNLMLLEYDRFSPDRNGPERSELAKQIPAWEFAFGSSGGKERPTEAPCPTTATANSQAGLESIAGIAAKKNIFPSTCNCSRLGKYISKIN